MKIQDFTNKQIRKMHQKVFINFSKHSQSQVDGMKAIKKRKTEL